jgi:hypothetical protein
MYEGGSGTGQSHSMQAGCGNLLSAPTSCRRTLTVRNRSGSDSITRNVNINKIAGCF